MAKHNYVGKLGEEIAKKHLASQGYLILDLNWRWGKGEIDIIAQQNNVLVFIEVKTRTQNTFGYPEEAISTKKQQLMYELAIEYMYQHQHEDEFRFDVIAITLSPTTEIEHFQDAFFPSWND